MKNMLKNFFNTRFLLYLLALNIITLFFIYSQRDNLQYVPTYSKEHKNINFDSKSSDKNLSTYKEFRETKKAEIKDVEISFDATVYSVSQYDNIFQTAPENRGIRMELSKALQLGLIIGYNNKEKFVGRDLFTSSEPLILNHPYHIKINLDKNNILNIYVDSEQVLPDQSKFIPHAQYEISDIAVGTGFNKTRSFNGKVENFSIRYSYYKIDPQLAEKTLVFPSITFFLILLGILWKWKWKFKPIAEYFKKRTTLKESLKFEYYPFLIASFPILFIVSNNFDKIVFLDFIQPLLISITLTFILYLILNFFFSYKTTAVIISLLLIYFYSAGHVYNMLKTDISPEIFIFIFSIIFLTLLFLLTVKTQTSISNLFKGISVVLVILSLINISLQIPKSSILISTNNQPTKEAKEKITKDSEQLANKPDIYYIILDAYANNWTLNKFFNFDNSSFLNYLKEKGFYIAEKSTTNYRLTPLSVGSSLNMRYFSEKIGDYNYLGNQFVNNKVGKWLKERGYMYININPDGAIVETNPNADINDNCNQGKEFDLILLQTTILFNSNFVINDIPRRQVLCAFESTSKLIFAKSPKFFYIHVLPPHWPYVFDKDGGYVPKDERYDKGDPVISLSLNKDRYLNQLLFTNKKIEALVEEILSKSKSPPIIIIQSDHGPDLYLDREINKGEKMPSDEFLKARMRNLSAFYLPKGGNKVIPEDITPVNIFRYIFNYYFKTNFEILENINYYSPNNQPFNFTDVTDKIKF